MSLPDDLPTTHPERPKLPEIVTNTGVEPALTANDMRTFRISSPLLTHFTPKTCAEVNCFEYRFGWRVVADPNTDLGTRQIDFIQHSGLTYTQWYDDDTETITFEFNPGQNSWVKHWERSNLEPEYSTFIGDYRGGGQATILTQAEWSTMVTRWFRGLRERQRLLMSAGRDIPGLTRRRLPSLRRFDDSPPVFPFGYSILVGHRDVTDMVTDVQLHLPRRADDLPLEARALSLDDAGMTMVGVRDTRESNALKGVQRLVGRSVRLRVSATPGYMDAVVLIPTPTVTRASDVISWQMAIRFSDRQAEL